MTACFSRAHRGLVAGLAVLLVTGLIGVLAGGAAAQSSDSQISVITVDGAIDAVAADYLSRALDVAAERGAALAIVLLDTPGGLLDSTRKMVEDILSSSVPVAVYVFPPGAQAASAGTFVMAAGHVAAMAPSTNVGAAAPVGPSGEDLPETLASKATEDAAAFLRSIADERGRNADALEATVLDSASYSAGEAVDLRVADLVASDIDDLIEQLDGRSVELAGAEQILEIEGLPTETINRNLLERFLGVIANPNIALLLLSIGGFGILIEFYNPGSFIPGVFGVLALALAFVALGNLPVNWTGFGLIALSMVLFFVELQAPGVSVPGILGGIAFLVGAFLLFGGFSPQPLDGPSFRVSVWVLVGIGTGIAAIMVLLIRTSLRARRMPQLASQHGLAAAIGQTGGAATALDPAGTVLILGEEWSALSETGARIERGEQVRVTAFKGLVLIVRRAGEMSDDE